MRVTAFTNRCIASGSCVLVCSQVFSQHESDGVVEVLQEHPPLTLLEKVRQAVNACPSLALEAEDEENTSELTITTNDQDD
jgi:ferredoxin